MFKQVKSNRLEKNQLCGKGDCLIQSIMLKNSQPP